MAEVRGRIAAAAARAGRAADEIRLVAVTKYVEPPVARALALAGCRDLGESRPQELWKKADALADVSPRIRWHLIGHLQRNKVDRTAPLVSMIHAVDSERLLTALAAAPRSSPSRLQALLEVNISGESAKLGFQPDALVTLAPNLLKQKGVEILGLMGMAGLSGGEAETRRDFRRLRELRDRLRSLCPEGVALNELSMGMSGDFETAIEEGATIVRLGGVLFEGIVL